MKKLISSLLVIQILFTFFLPKHMYAYEDTLKSSFGDMTLDAEKMQESLENGTTGVGGNGDKSFVPKESSVSSVGKTLIKILNVFPTIVSGIMTIVAYDEDDFYNNQKYGYEFSIEKLVFNKIKVFDINFFEIDTTSTETYEVVKQYIAKVFVYLRYIAIVMSLVILIYIAIRMAISTVSLEKARYKKLLIDWVIGFVFLVGIQYFMILIIQVSNLFLELIQTIYESMCSTNKLESIIINEALNSKERGLGIIIPSIIYWILVFYQLKFFWMYFKRLFSLGFLIVISPLVVTLYSLDKASDGQAQTLKVWSKEFILNIIMQPMHALMYMIFFVTAANIASVAPIITVVFLAALSRCERVIRNVFRVNNAITVQSMKDSAISYSNFKKLK